MKHRSIQGLRAYLAALVVASHCNFLGQGGAGSMLFLLPFRFLNDKTVFKKGFVF